MFSSSTFDTPRLRPEPDAPLISTPRSSSEVDCHRELTTVVPCPFTFTEPSHRLPNSDVHPLVPPQCTLFPSRTKPSRALRSLRNARHLPLQFPSTLDLYQFSHLCCLPTLQTPWKRGHRHRTSRSVDSLRDNIHRAEVQWFMGIQI